MDGVRVLLDGVSAEVYPYSATPPSIRDALLSSPPDAMAFTHDHPDHFDRDYVNCMQNRTHLPVLGPVGLPVAGLISERLELGKLTIRAIPSRHIGKQERGAAHVSFLLEGSRRVLFTGDASPLQWQETGLPKADVLIATYGFGISKTGWQIAKSCGAEAVIFLHLPEPQRDPYGLHDALKQAAGRDQTVRQYTPDMGQSILLTK